MGRLGGVRQTPAHHRRSANARLVSAGFPIHAEAFDESIGGFGVHPQSFRPRLPLEIGALLFEKSREEFPFSFPGRERVIVVDEVPELGEVVILPKCVSEIIDRGHNPFDGLGPQFGECFQLETLTDGDR